MKLIKVQLSHNGSSSSNKEGEVQQQQQELIPPWQAAALQLPLLQQFVYSTTPKNKAWAAAVLSQLKQQQQQQHGRTAIKAAHLHQEQQQQQQQASFSPLQGPLASVTAAERWLQAWWSSSSNSSTAVPPVLTWLEGLTAALLQLRQRPGSDVAAGGGTLSNSSSSSSVLMVPLPLASSVKDMERHSTVTGKGNNDTCTMLLSTGAAAWYDSQGVDPAVQLLLAALLQHPQPAVVAAAAAALQQLLLLVPQLAPGFLPLVLQQLKVSCTATVAAAAPAATAAAAAARNSAALLQLLPAMCVDTSTAALVWRMLQPVLAVQAVPRHIKQQPGQLPRGSSSINGLARSVAVQLAVQAWQYTGRGWNRAEAAINGCIKYAGTDAAAAAAEPPELRLIRAAAVRCVSGGTV
jgi:hypothetical protein